ncbi:hypothetical protein TCAL_12498, partial [Tigriopus californicus]
MYSNMIPLSPMDDPDSIPMSNPGTPHVTATAGANITLACPGVSPTSYIYLVEWKCVGCRCQDCPNPHGEGLRILRYNDKLMRWDNEDERRNLDMDRSGLKFEPVTSADSGTYMCLINNRREPDSPIVLIVQDVPDPPPSRPLVVRLDSRSVDLSWAPPRRNHHHHVISYKIFIKEGETGSWDRTVETSSNLTRFHIKDLQPFTTYMFRVSAKNLLGYSKPSKESYPTMTHREKPSGSPTFLRDKISTSSTSLSIVWQPPPKQTLNGEFLGYEMTYRPKNERRSTKLTINEDILRIQNYTIGNLQKHTTYVISLSVKNLKGVGPNATIELRTEDGVPLEPQRPRFSNVTAQSLVLSWQMPSNARNLGSDLLGYRIYVTEMCEEARSQYEIRYQPYHSRRCRKIQPFTINSGSTTQTLVDGLTFTLCPERFITKLIPSPLIVQHSTFPGPYTKYKIVLRAFTKKREGPASDALILMTDTSPPGAPIITNITCYGTDELQIEWRRPDQDSAIKYYKILLNHRDRRDQMRTEEIHVEIVNDTLKNVAFLSNLTTESIYDLRIVAFVESFIHPGKLYQGPTSHARRIFVGRECDPHQAFSKVHDVLEFNAGIVAGIICTATSLVLLALVMLICRRHKPRYEFLALTPKYMAAGRGGPGSPPINGGPQGWISDHESDIPISLLPKHVSGLHACDNMAFHKDFESIHSARLLRHANDAGSLIGNVHAANTYPDILNGRPDCGSHSTCPIFLDGWLVPFNFICLLGEAPLASESTWIRLIWEQHVGMIVTLLTSVAKDDLSTLSDSKRFGDIIVTLQTEDILPDYTIRTMKLSHRKFRKAPERYITQLIFGRYPEIGLPHGSDFLNFTKAAFAVNRTSGGKILVQSRNGLDSCLVYAKLHTMLDQIQARGEVNIPCYSRHLSSVNDVALSSVDQFIYVHDVLAEAVEYGQLHSILQANASMNSNGSLSMPQ